MTHADPLGQKLLEAGLVRPADLERALQLRASMGGRLGAILVRIGAISEAAVLPVMGETLAMEVVGDEAMPSAAEAYQAMEESPLDLDWFIDHEVVLWRSEESGLRYAATDVLNPYVAGVLARVYPDDEPSPVLMRSDAIDALLEHVKREHAVEDLFQGSDQSRALLELAEEAPVIEFVNNVLTQAIDAGASDIHIEPGEAHFQVRFRIDGVLHIRMQQPQERFAAIASRIKLIAGLDIAERRLPQDGRLSTRLSGREMDIRVSTAPDVRGESIVMRLLPKDREDVDLAGLGMEADHLALMRRWAAEAHGIVLVTGPTGSGKSTTLYATLSVANDGSKKVITVEDPVEYQLEGITQIQAHTEIGYTFARALKAILRQDPDVIMIGEIRDLETADIAIQSALTGHLVLSTLHTNTAVSTFTRLIDMGVEPFLVAAPMLGVQAQRLVRTLCRDCAQPAELPEAILREIEGLGLLSREELSPRKAVGCAQCQGTGYRGRVGIYELVEMSQALHSLIVENRPEQEMRRLVESQGFRNLRQDGLIKVGRGQTTMEEVLRVVGAETLEAA